MNLAQNLLKLHESEVHLFGHPTLTSYPKNNLGNISCDIHAHNFGVIFHSDLWLDHQTTKAVQSCFMQIRNIAKVKNFLCRADLEVITHAFISSPLDCRNSLYSALNHKETHQLSHNSAARLLTNSKKKVHISPTLTSLHCQPV